MKFIKGISLFFVYPITVFVLGFVSGIKTQEFFYPEYLRQEGVITVDTQGETLCADTEYVVEEVDVLTQSSREVPKNLPRQYFGMDRTQFMAVMENFEAAPPLIEQQRGFESLEVLSFSRELVKVRMNYREIKPDSNFYLVVMNHEVVVLLEDKRTVYFNTGIMLDTLPEEIQLEIIQMYYVESERDLYNFLETYSS